MDSYKVEIISEDNKPITERTGSIRAIGTTTYPKPIVGLPFIVMYDPGQASHPTNPSPGISSWPAFVEQIGNEFRYKDEQGRAFRVRYLSNILDKH